MIESLSGGGPLKEIQIRPIRKEDISGLNEIRRQPAVTENTLGLPSERIERTEEFFNRLGPDDHVFVAVTEYCGRNGGSFCKQRKITSYGKACFDGTW